MVASHLGRDFSHDSVVTSAVRDVSLALVRGRVTALMGPSGCGKSTLLHLLSGLDRPTTGTVHVDGTNLAELSEADHATLRSTVFGFVLQRDNLVPSLTVLENVAAPLVAGGMRRRSAAERSMGYLHRVGLTGKASAWPSSLSGGEAQRVAVARACATEPRVVFADEPTGALDSASASVVLDLIVELVHDAGAAALVVTHDRDVAARADETLRMHDGQLV